MATETIILEVKSNIKSATAETKEWGKSIKDVSEDIGFQKMMLIELEADLLKLKRTQSKLSPWENSLNKTTQKITEQKYAITDQKGAIKKMAQAQKNATTAAKDFNQEQKDQGNLLKDGIGNFRVMGVSLNGVKKAFGKIIPTAKLMFSTIKAGLISTGIGILVVAFGTLMAWFSKTKVGAEALEKIFAAVGAVVSVIVDRITAFATAVGKLFSGDIKGALTGMKESFTGIGDEMMREAALALALKQSLQDLADSERALSVETAQRRAEIEDLKLLSEDLTLTEEERIEALEQASEIEGDLLAKRVENAEEFVRIHEEQMGMSESLAEDLDELAQLEINLANIRRESARQQQVLIRKTQRIRKSAAAKRKKASEDAIKQMQKEADEQKRLDDEWKARTEANDQWNENNQKRLADLQNQNYLNELEDLQFQAEEKLRIEREAQLVSLEYKEAFIDEQEALDKEYNLKVAALKKQRDANEINRDKSVMDAKLDMAQNTLGAMAALAGENEAAGKAIAVAQTIFATQQAIMSALAGGGTDIVLPYWVKLGNAISAGVMGAVAIKTILSTSSGSGGGGGGGGGSVPSASAVPPAPQMMSGAFELGSGQEIEPVQAYVVSDDITDSQNSLEIIRRRATI
jgi:hypothetical protein